MSQHIRERWPFAFVSEHNVEHTPKLTLLHMHTHASSPHNAADRASSPSPFPSLPPPPPPVLLQHGADPGIRNTDGKSPSDLADPLTKTVLSGEYKREELLEAAKQGNEDKVLSLLTPLNVNSHAGDGRKVHPHTPHTHTHTHTHTYTHTYTNMHTDTHRTFCIPQSSPLHLAAGFNRVNIVKSLLKFGADVHAKDRG